MEKQKAYEPKFYVDGELKNRCGVYQIRNLINDKLYIGSSNNLLKRKKKEHLNNLRKNKHINTHLQDSYNKYGEENFIFEVIEFCNPEERIEIEQYWMDRLNVRDRKNGYNMCAVAGLPPHRKHTKEEIEAIRESAHCKKIICIEKNEIYNSLREASRVNDIASSNIRNCAKYKYRTIKGLHFLYYEEYILFNEHELEIALKKPKQVAHNKRAVLCLTNNQIYESVKEASNMLNINYKGIQKCCTKYSKTYKGYEFKYL